MGYVLLIGIIIVASTSVFVVGFMTVNDAQALAERGSADQAMTAFNSRASLVAFEGSDNQKITIPQTGDSQTYVKDTGRLTVTVVGVNKTDPTKTYVVEELYNDSFGTLVLEKKGYEVAYQGGGVWAMRNGNVNTSTVVSPPEFSYTDDTATIPVVGINKSSQVSNGEISLERSKTTPIFPHGTSNNTTNPVNPYHNLVISIQSDYYQAWGQYFEDNTGLRANYDHENDTVTVYLVSERESSGVMSNAVTSVGAEDRIQIKGSGAGSTFIDSYDSTVGDYSTSQTDEGTISAVTGIRAKGQVDFYGNVETEGDLILSGNSCVHGDAVVDGSIIFGGKSKSGECPVEGTESSGAEVESAPIADGVIADVTSKLSTDNDNNDTAAITNELEGELDTDSNPELEAGVYYIEELDIEDGETVTFNVTNGDVKLLVDDDVEVDGEINVIGNMGTDNRAQIYTRSNQISFSEALVETEGQEAAGMWFYGPSGTDIVMDSHSKVTGVIYAVGIPSSPGSVTMTTHSELFGAVIGGTTQIKSQSKVHQDLATADDPVFKGAVQTEMFWSEVQYFHISKTEINASS